LYHGHSFTANPVACAASLASLDILLDEKTLANINRIAVQHSLFREKIANHPKVKTSRQTGTIIAIEWETGESTTYLSSLRDKLYTYFLNKGIVLRPLGNIVYILPPYIITNEELAYIYSTIFTALDEI
jgi:adenosylmethionine-8-amino-7-oxononanoate aminotransferase